MDHDARRDEKGWIGHTASGAGEAPLTQPAGQMMSPPSQRLTLDTVDAAFRYQPWDELQRDQGEQVRDVLVAAAKVILRTVPDTPLRTRALNNLIDARMLANAAISFRGRF